MVTKAVTKGKRSVRLRRSVGIVIAIIGYILSPLSWWNDALVNIPISLAIAYLLHTFLGIDELLGFYLGYLASNVIGMFMLIYGSHLVARPQYSFSKRDIMIGLVTSFIYTVIASVVLYFIGLL